MRASAASPGARSLAPRPPYTIMSIEYIIRPELKLNSIRERALVPNFRPSATGNDIDLLHKKVRMEALEVSASEGKDPSFIACAAHEVRDNAIQHAKFEAVERLSVASWWAFERPWLAPFDQETTALFGSYINDGSMSVDGGYVEPACGLGFLAVAILRDDTRYPIMVMGSNFAMDKFQAAEGAFFEAAQSWIGSTWIQDRYPGNAPHWDTSQLRKRYETIHIESPVGLSLDVPYEESTLDTFFEDKIIISEEHAEGHVAWVYTDTPTNGYTYEIARLCQKSGEKLVIFTQCNY